MTRPRLRVADVPLPGPDAAPAAGTPTLVWIDGHAVAPDAPHLSALDRGFTLADGVFETMRVRGGVAFRCEQHLRRLAAGAAALRIALRADVGAMVDRALAEGAAAGLRDAALRVTVSRGPAPPGAAPPPSTAPTVAIVLSPPPALPAALHADGLSIAIASGRRNEHATSSGLKTLAYTDAVIALLDSRAAGADDALFLDTAGHVSEATFSNVFLVRDGALVTPPSSCGVLAGVTRAAVRELAVELGLPCEERVVWPDELRAADELFLTSSLRGIAPVVAVDGRPLRRARPGPITQRLAEGYASLVRRECGA